MQSILIFLISFILHGECVYVVVVMLAGKNDRNNKVKECETKNASSIIEKLE